MAEPKKPEKTAQPAEERFEVDMAELEAEEVRSRLSADDEAYLKTILEAHVLKFFAPAIQCNAP